MILTIVRWIFTLPVFGIEWVLKGLAFLVLVLVMTIYYVFYPALKNRVQPEYWFLYSYATEIKGEFPLTNIVWKAWS